MAETIAIRDLKECPVCQANWDDGDIYEVMRKSEHYKDLSDEQVREAVKSYGWTPETPRSFSRLVGIEVMGEYDGVSYWQCPDCKSTWDRWTNEKVVTDFNNQQS